MSDVIKKHGQTNMNPDGVGFWSLVAEDFATHDRDFFAQGFWAVFWHRFGNWRMSVRWRPLRVPLSVIYRVMAKLGEIMGGISLPYSVVLGRRVKLEHFGGMVLIAKQIGDDVVIRQNTTFGIASLEDLQARPTIGDRVQLGAGVVVIGDIEIGADTIVGANAVVTQNLPAGVVAVGVPARILKELEPRSQDD